MSVVMSVVMSVMMSVVMSVVVSKAVMRRAPKKQLFTFGGSLSLNTYLY